MRCRAEQNKVDLSIVDQPLPTLRIDRLRTKQVLLNVLSNAIKFTEEGGRVTVASKIERDGTIVVSVTDTGIGIAPEMIPLAFEPFRQVDSALSRKFEGTGLGLSLVKTFMELHGGAVKLESAIAHGTTVRLIFPLDATSELKASA